HQIVGILECGFRSVIELRFKPHQFLQEHARFKAEDSGIPQEGFLFQEITRRFFIGFFTERQYGISIMLNVTVTRFWTSWNYAKGGDISLLGEDNTLIDSLLILLLSFDQVVRWRDNQDILRFRMERSKSDGCCRIPRGCFSDDIAIKCT